MMRDVIKSFPEGVALGDAFINRVVERKELIKRIQANQHSVLMAPRRYGKTSLVTKVAEEMGLPYCSIDLLAAYNIEYVRDQLVEKAGVLAVEMLPALNKAKEKLIRIFKGMRPEISIGAFGQKLTLHLSNSALQDITDVLVKLDETAKQFKQKAVIFIDEFQQISQLKNYQSIEAAIRHAVERSQYISYVFSGSNRRLLAQMFGDQSRPLYRLCQTISLERMSADVYSAYLKTLAQKHWRRKLPDDVFANIIRLTELHPFYMNALCQLLWDKEKLPTADEVALVWEQYVKVQRQLISHDIVGLSPNQRKLMMALAKAPTKEIQSAEFTAPIRISASSAQQAAEILLQKDLIMQNNDGAYVVLDPAMRYYLATIL